MHPSHTTLTLSQIAALIQAPPRILRDELSLLPEEVLRWRPAPDEWCIKEVIGHLIEADRNGFDGRIRVMLAEDRPQLSGWAVNETAARRRDCEGDVLALLDELAAMRTRSAQLVTNLQPDQLKRTGIHPVVGELAVSDLLYEWVHHDHNHLKQIWSNLQAFIWPSMGNTQKFSEAGKMPT